MPEATSCNPHRKVYRAADKQYSIIDLLSSAIDSEYMRNGLPRISDFHFKVGQAVRFRMDEELHAIPEAESLTQEQVEQLVYPLLSERDRKRMQDDPLLDIDSGYSLALDGGTFSYRINAFRDSSGLAAVIRLLPPRIPSIDTIGFPNEMIWKRILGLKQGLVIVTGVTGSGKSTTIASLLDTIIQTRGMRIITLEDPIEYAFKSNHSLISQREVGEHVSSFQAGLRSALRENPDIIFVGEIRDIETAALTLTAAETGHLVFATLHTRDSVGALTRMIDMFPPERERELGTQLSFGLAYVISQKLVARADGSGRMVAMEVFRNSPVMANYLRTGKLHQLYTHMETGSGQGMNTMEQRLVELYEAGHIERSEAILHANRDDIINRLPPE